MTHPSATSETRPVMGPIGRQERIEVVDMVRVLPSSVWSSST